MKSYKELAKVTKKHNLNDTTLKTANYRIQCIDPNVLIQMYCFKLIVSQYSCICVFLYLYSSNFEYRPRTYILYYIYIYIYILKVRKGP